MTEILRGSAPTPNTWNGGAFYQIYPRTFRDSNDDGVGDIIGIREKLPYLSSLDIDVIWLSPPYSHGGVDGGYDVTKHTEIAQELGTLQDMDNLITAAHELGIKVVLDFVPNHTSNQHEWFESSCQDPDGEFGDYYIWANPKKLQPGEPALPHNIIAGDRLEGLPEGYTVPNNWSSIFSLPVLDTLKKEHGGIIPDDVEVPAITAWVWHPGRQQFYLAEFAKEQPSLQWANPDVRKSQIDIVRFWLDRGVDGFRVDAINHIGKDTSLRDEERMPDDRYDKNSDNPHDQWGQQRMMSHWETLEPYVLEILDAVDNDAYKDKDIRFILEDWLTAMAGGMGNDQLSRLRPEMATVFNLIRLLKTNQKDWHASIHKHLLDTYHLAFLTDPELKGGIPNEVDSNHDVSRVATRLARQAARSAALIKLTTPGSPYIFQGEELGLEDVPYQAMVERGEISLEQLKDTKHAGRDGERAPIPWNADKNGGFSQAAPENLWLPVNPDYMNRHAEDQAKDPLSFYSLYRALLRARRRSEELKHGSYNPMETDHGNVLAFGRPHLTERRQMITVANFSGETTEVAILNTGQALARVAISSERGLVHGRDDLLRLDQGRISLAPYEALLLEPPV